MANWQERHTDWSFRIPGQIQETQVEVSSVIDNNGDDDHERAKFILRDDPSNQGPSMMSREGAGAAIQSLCAESGIEPDDVDWYAMDKDGQMYSIGITSEMKTVENPTYTELKKDLSLADWADAKKAYPDIHVEEFKGDLQELTLGDRQEVDDCYLSARVTQELEMAGQKEQNNPNQENEQNKPNEHQNSPNAQDYDLSKYNIHFVS